MKALEFLSVWWWVLLVMAGTCFIYMRIAAGERNKRAWNAMEMDNPLGNIDRAFRTMSENMWPSTWERIATVAFIVTLGFGIVGALKAFNVV